MVRKVINLPLVGGTKEDVGIRLFLERDGASAETLDLSLSRLLLERDGVGAETLDLSLTFAQAEALVEQLSQLIGFTC